MNEMALIPVQDVKVMAKAVADGKMFGCKTEAQAMSLMLIAQADGMHPMTALRKYHVLSDGRPSMRSDAMLAGYRQLGGKVKWVTKPDDREKQAGLFEFEGQSVEVAYSFAEAKQANLVRNGSGWTKDPAAMMRARVISRAVRMFTPEVVVGFYTPEEMSDIPAPPNKPQETASKVVETILTEALEPERGDKPESLEEQYETFKDGADTIEKWEKLGAWLTKHNATQDLIQKCADDFDLWKEFHPVAEG